jgi:hypothetical protein
MYSVDKAPALLLGRVRAPAKLLAFKVSQVRQQDQTQQLAAPLVLWVLLVVQQDQTQQLAAPLVRLLSLAVLLVHRRQLVWLLVLKATRAASLASVFPLAPPMARLHLSALLTVKVLAKALALVVLHLVAMLLVFRFRQVPHPVHLMGHRHRHRPSLRFSLVTCRFSNMCQDRNQFGQDRNNRNPQCTQVAQKATHRRLPPWLVP